MIRGRVAVTATGVVSGAGGAVSLGFGTEAAFALDRVIGEGSVYSPSPSSSASVSLSSVDDEDEDVESVEEK